MKHTFMGLATLLGGFLGLGQSAQAQGSYTEDALMYSRLGPSGTARTLGIGGASTALGADFSNLTTNPAGLGFYTKSELTFTPGIGFGNAKAAPISNAASLGSNGSLTQSANRFQVANAGIVFANRHPDSDDRAWRGGSFALGFTRQADFNQAFRYQNTTNDDHSFYQFLREPGGNGDYTSTGYQQAVQGILDQFDSGNYTDLDGLAFGSYITDTARVHPPGSRNLLSRVYTPVRSGNITQNELISSKGSQSQFDLGYGGNYLDRLYIGVGVGLVSLNRTRTSTYSESSNGAENFDFEQNTRTTGTGVNARLGLIYRPIDMVRFGASIQTPTYIHLHDEYNTTLNAYYPLIGPGTPNTQYTTPGTFDYSITTPFRASGGVVVLLNKYGFLSGDVEYVGYSQTSYKNIDPDPYGDLDYANQSISTGYRNTVNVRVGAEGRFDIFRVRAGYAHYGNPYVASSPSRGQDYITGGLGVRTKSFFVDASGVYLTYKQLYSPYSLATDDPSSNFKSVANGVAPVIDVNQHRFTVSLTGGLIF
jgi:hypothetical protein